MRLDAVLVAFYRRLLHLYPKRTRDKLEDDLVDLFTELLHGARAHGRLGPIRFALKAYFEVPFSALGALRNVDEFEALAPSGVELSLWEQFRQDLRFALRALRRTPVFAAVAITTMALGIGATTAIFTVVKGVLLTDLPYDEPEELVVIYNEMGRGGRRVGISPAAVPELQNLTGSLEQVASAWSTSTNLAGVGPAVQITLTWTTPDFMQLLGVEPQLGRTFREGDAITVDPGGIEPGFRPPTAQALISDGLWRTKFAADPDVVGRSFEINGQPMNVIGVMPPGFRLHVPVGTNASTRTDVWTLIPMDLSRAGRRGHNFLVLGRLAEGASVAMARLELERIAAWQRSHFEYDRSVDLQLTALPLAQEVVTTIRPALLSLVAAVGIVLLIACANIANLFLVRAATRNREMAIRSALGGGRGRLARLMLTEGLVVALIGGIAGLGFAHSSVDLLVHLRPAGLPRLDAVGIDVSVLMFALATSVGAALLFGLAPATQIRRLDLIGSLRERSRMGLSSKLRNTLVVAEVSLSIVLLVGAGLMLRTFASLHEVELGFDPQDVVTADVSLPYFPYLDRQDRVEFFETVTRRLSQRSELESVGATTGAPLARGVDDFAGPWALAPNDEAALTRNRAAYFGITPGYLETIGARLLAGRGFEWSDNRADAQAVAIVDDAFAHAVWGDESALGKSLYVRRMEDVQVGWTMIPATVVGVVGHVRSNAIRASAAPTIYLPHQLLSWGEMTLVAKTLEGPAHVGSLMREETVAQDPTIPVFDLRRLEDHVAVELAPERFVLTLSSLFAAIALVLATVGLYGVVSYSTAQKAREIGVRLAFGAERSRILASVMGHGLRLALVGLIVGIAASVGISELIAGLVYGVPPRDPVTISVIAAVILAASALATLLPALRASKLDPVVTLRAE